MAEGTRLQLTFDTMSGSKTWSFNYAKPSASVDVIKAVGQAMVTNGSIFENVPISLRSAKTVTTSENVYDLS